MATHIFYPRESLIIDRTVSGSVLNQLVINVQPETIFFLNDTGSLSEITASTVEVGNALSSSYSLTSSYSITSSHAVLANSSSHAVNVDSSSYSPTSSVSIASITSSYSVTASYSNTSTYANTAGTASIGIITNIQSSASWASQSYHAETASLLLGSIGSSIFASSSISASYALTSSITTLSSFATTASYATTAITASYISSGSLIKQNESFIFACSDETTPITASAEKVSFRMPYPFQVTSVRASLTTPQTSGNIFTVDINESFTSILSTKLTIDNTETTSTTAATASVISDPIIADDALITVDVDQVGDGTAKGLKVTIIGRQI